jgi:hypothetical protein
VERPLYWLLLLLLLLLLQLLFLLPVRFPVISSVNLLSPPATTRSLSPSAQDLSPSAQD